MVQARITKFLLWTVRRTLVFRDKISCTWVRGFCLNKGMKEGYPLKSSYFTAIGVYSVKTIANGYRHVAYHNKH